MKALTTLGLFLLTAMLPLVAQQPVDTLQRATLALDSIPTSYEWRVRAPLTEEDRQRREDNRAEVEDMKRRFRRFHQAEDQGSDSTLKEDENYLWSAPAGSMEPKPAAVPAPPTPTDSEALRMEIGRSLQVGKRADVPATPVLPTEPPTTSPPDTGQPTSYSRKGPPTPASTPPLADDWQADLKTALQPEGQAKTAWEEKLTAPEATPTTATPFKTGQVILLEQVAFAEQSSVLATDSQQQLALWGALLLQNPGLHLELRTHVNSTGNAARDLELSVHRAQTIVDYWRRQGVAGNQLSYRGFGHQYPLLPADNPLAQQKNERIEVIILEMP